MKRLSMRTLMLVVLFVSRSFQGCSDETYHWLTVTTGSDGTITAPTTSPIAVKPGTATTIDTTPSEGYQFLNWSIVSGTGVTIDDVTSASTTVTLTGEDATIQANFIQLAQYQLTVNAGNHGTIAVPSSSPATVTHGVATTITATPNTGYSFVNWTVTSGTEVTFGRTTSATTTITLAGGDATIQANFTPNIIKVAGKYTLGSSGDGGPATSAEIGMPSGVAVDSVGNFYIADGWGNCIRKVDVTSGIITTVAGHGTTIEDTGDGGPATAAQLAAPSGLVVDRSGNIYIVESWTSRVRKVDISGIITTVAGNGNMGYTGDNTPATLTSLYQPSGVAVDSRGNFYIADRLSSRIRKVDTSGIITTVAGNGTQGYSGDDGPATSAELFQPAGVAVDSRGNLYIADTLNQRVRKVDATSKYIATVAGGGSGGLGDNGPATSAYLLGPIGVVVDSSGNLYIADSGNNRIRRVDTSGTITTVAGGSMAGDFGDNGPATSAGLDYPMGVAVDSSGNIYTADRGTCIRMVYAY